MPKKRHINKKPKTAPTEARNRPISLHPLTFEQAVVALLKVKPKKKK
jgi:hypothetical protein